MPDFTKSAIKASFLKLLNEQPLSKISVRGIVKDGGINRHSFYYHYHIPSAQPHYRLYIAPPRGGNNTHKTLA